MKAHAKLKHLAHGAADDLYRATFLVTFTLVSGADWLSELPVYEYLEGEANRSIERALALHLDGDSLPDGDPPDSDDYELAGPCEAGSWGRILWTTERAWTADTLKDKCPSLLAAWQAQLEAQPQSLHCPVCNGTQVRLVGDDGGYECVTCEKPGHESWFWIWRQSETNTSPFLPGADGWDEADPPADLPLELAIGTPLEAQVRARMTEHAA